MMEHDYPNIAHYVPDLMAERALVAINRYYYTWVLLGLLVPAVIGGLATQSAWGVLSGFLWGGAVRMFVVEQTMSAINSVMHTFGARPFATRDDNSRNLGVMALLAWGEGWHNNHHAFPYSAAFGLRRFELDPGFHRYKTDGDAGSRLECQSSEQREDRTSPDASGDHTRRPILSADNRRNPARKPASPLLRF